MKSLTVPAREECVDEVLAFVGRELESCDCPMKERYEIELAIEEIFVNIASYAYKPVEGEAEVRCEALRDPTRVVIQFLDKGRPYDPLGREDPDTSLKALEEREGGLGILLVKRTMGNVSYAYENGKNILTIQKEI